MVFVRAILEFVNDDQYRNLIVTSLGIIAFGSIFYHYVEGWSIIDSIYFSFITLTTIGYGDICPQTEIGKIFTIFYVILSLGIILGFINTVYEHYQKKNENAAAPPIFFNNKKQKENS